MESCRKGKDVGKYVRFIYPEDLNAEDEEGVTHSVTKKIIEGLEQLSGITVKAHLVVKASAECFGAHRCYLVNMDVSNGDIDPLQRYDLEKGFAEADELERWSFGSEIRPYMEELFYRGRAFFVKMDDIRTDFPNEYQHLCEIGANCLLAVPTARLKKGLLVYVNPSWNENHFALIYGFRRTIDSLLNEQTRIDNAYHILGELLPEAENDVVMTLLGTLELRTIRGTIRADELKAMKEGIRLFLYLSVQPGFSASKDRILEDLEGLDGRNLNKQAERFNEKFKTIIGSEPFIVCEKHRIFLNPYYRITTDLIRFDEMKAALRESVHEGHSIRILKNLMKIYNGRILEMYIDEHWVIDMRDRYHARFLESAYQLLRYLYDRHQYSKLNGYASQAIHKDEHNHLLYYWNLVALCKSEKREMAIANMRIASDELDDEGWKELLRKLRETPGIHCDHLNAEAEKISAQRRRYA